jgi:ribosomal protein L40E
MSSRKKKAKHNRREKARLERERRKISATRAQEPGPWRSFSVWRELREAASALIAGNPGPAQEKPVSAPICRECRATNDPGASECWLCGRRDWRADPTSPTTKPRAEKISDHPRLMSSLETILIVLALAVVGAGVVRLAPGLGIAFLILLVPAWATVEWAARRRNAPMSAARRFFAILGVTILIPVLLVLSLLTPLFAICAALIAI